MSEAEERLLPLILIIVAGVVVRVSTRWIQDAAPAPDPWGPEMDQALRNHELPPTCPHCSAPHSETDYICPGCGDTVGDYTNYSPYLYIFSLGDVLRLGTMGRFRVSWLTITGYLLLSTKYACFAPVYWVLLFMNVGGSPLKAAAAPPPLTSATT